MVRNTATHEISSTGFARGDHNAAARHKAGGKS
jgi:sarcosine oxidase subunit delta